MSSWLVNSKQSNSKQSNKRFKNYVNDKVEMTQYLFKVKPIRRTNSDSEMFNWILTGGLSKSRNCLPFQNDGKILQVCKFNKWLLFRNRLDNITFGIVKRDVQFGSKLFVMLYFGRR